jgi:hypothetical protein
MLNPQPQRSTGMLLQRREDSGANDVLGSCFLFRSHRIALTAAHCLPNEGTKLWAFFPMLPSIMAKVVETRKHWTRDIALIVLEWEGTAQIGPFDIFWDCPENWSLGMDVMAFGYPDEATGPAFGSSAPTARLFKGHIQRYFDYQPPTVPMGRSSYVAGEMSIRRPGGPVWRAGVLCQ